jgi:hypothetical protein
LFLSVIILCLTGGTTVALILTDGSFLTIVWTALIGALTIAPANLQVQ